MIIQLIDLTQIALVILGIAAAIFGYLTSEGIKEYRYKKGLLATIASLISVLSLTIVFYLYHSKTPKTHKPSDIQSQLARIDNVQKSLTDLNKFLSEQKRRLYDAETTIKNLENERAKLKPIVEADRKTVEAFASIIAEIKSSEQRKKAEPNC
jgi:DNA repair exonuclease SbcCD ATPase subunit